MATTTKRRPKKENNALAPELTTIQGTVQRRIFYNAENGYCVLIVKPSIEGTPEESFDLDVQDELKATGCMPTVREGDTYKFTGSFTTHPKFGPQFKFSQS